jgi:hypothetical protein
MATEVKPKRITARSSQEDIEDAALEGLIKRWSTEVKQHRLHYLMTVYHWALEDRDES